MSSATNVYVLFDPSLTQWYADSCDGVHARVYQDILYKMRKVLDHHMAGSNREYNSDESKEQMECGVVALSKAVALQLRLSPMFETRYAENIFRLALAFIKNKAAADKREGAALISSSFPLVIFFAASQVLGSSLGSRRGLL